MADASIKHKLAAILAADAAGFSRLMAADERATLMALDAARAVFREQIESHQGRVIDMAGDSVLAVFETATGAVGAALEIQQVLTLAGAAEAAETRMRFRIGVHLGDVFEKQDGTVYGDGVNVAARLEGLAEPGGIVVSDAVRGVVNGRVDAGFTDKGPQALKNIARPIRAFAVVPGGNPALERAPADAAAAPAAANPEPRPSGVPATKQEGDPPSARSNPRPAGLFVGRKPELAQLTKALQGARKGFGRVVCSRCSAVNPLASASTRYSQAMRWMACLATSLALALTSSSNFLLA